MWRLDLLRRTFNSLFGILGEVKGEKPALPTSLSTPFSGFRELVGDPKELNTFNSLFGILEGDVSELVAQLRLSTPFSGFEPPHKRIQADDPALSTPFSGFSYFHDDTRTAEYDFQLPFRDSWLDSTGKTASPKTFNSLFGIRGP